METLCQSDGVKGNSAVLLKLVDWIRQHYGPRRPGKETSKPPTQATLFEVISPEAEQTALAVAKPRRKKVSARRGTGMFGKAMLKEAVQILPNLPDSDSLDEISSFLRNNLHFSAEQTRQRNTSYIIRRMFPEGYADAPMRLFAKAFPNTQELRDVCFYRFLLSEPLEVEIIEDLMHSQSQHGSIEPRAHSKAPFR